jgi:hypothetical protein
MNSVYALVRRGLGVRKYGGKQKYLEHLWDTSSACLAKGNPLKKLSVKVEESE